MPIKRGIKCCFTNDNNMLLGELAMFFMFFYD